MKKIIILIEEEIKAISIQRQSLSPQAENLFIDILPRLTTGDLRPTYLDNCGLGEHLYSRDAITNLANLPLDHSLIAHHVDLVRNIVEVGQAMDDNNAAYVRFVYA